MEDFGVRLRLQAELKFSCMECENLTCIHKRFLSVHVRETVDVSIGHW
jgi:hypothetical protein